MKSSWTCAAAKAVHKLSITSKTNFAATVNGTRSVHVLLSQLFDCPVTNINDGIERVSEFLRYCIQMCNARPWLPLLAPMPSDERSTASIGNFFLCLLAVENCAKQHTTAHRNGLHNVPKDRHMTIQYFLAAHDT